MAEASRPEAGSCGRSLHGLHDACAPFVRPGHGRHALHVDEDLRVADGKALLAAAGNVHPQADRGATEFQYDEREVELVAEPADRNEVGLERGGWQAPMKVKVELRRGMPTTCSVHSSITASHRAR